MENRIVMNTNNLQKNFRKIYETFFIESSTVFSGTFSFPWSPMGVGHRSKFTRVKSKLPIKVYVGIDVIPEKNVILSDVKNFNIGKNTFEEIEFKALDKQYEQIISVIKEVLADFGFEKGLKISVLSEGSRGHGLGFAGTFSAILAVGVYYILGKIDNKLLGNYEKFLESDVYKEVFALARKLDFVSRYGNSIGENSLYTLSNKQVPGVLYSEEISGDISLSKLDSLKYNFVEFDKFFEDRIVSNDLYLDYAIVFSGLKSETKQVENFMKSDEIKFNRYSSFIKDKFLDRYNPKDNVNFLKFANEKNIYDSLVDVLAILNIELLQSFEKIYCEEYDVVNVDHFINQINKFRNFNSVVENQSTFADDFMYFFRQNNIKGSEKAGIMPIYSGKVGGGYIVVMRYGESRIVLENTLKKLKEFYPEVVLEYASWIDGNCADGVKIEQSIGDNIFSQYMQQNKLYCKNNLGETVVGDFEKLFEFAKDSILFDSVHSKIYLNGKKITSKDLHSQSATVNLFATLIDRMGEDVYNNEFEVSTYSKNKNDMVGKIIIPLTKMIEKDYGKNISLICKGSLIDFFVKLNEKDLKISVIKRI